MAKNFHGKKEIRISDVLKTTDPKEQVKRAQYLIEAPVIDLIIRLDTRFQSLSVVIIGDNINYETAYVLLDRAREWLRQRELKEVAKPGQVEAPGPEQPELSTTQPALAPVEEAK